MDKLDKIVLKIRNSKLSEEDVLKYGRILIIDFAEDEHQKQLLLCGVGCPKGGQLKKTNIIKLDGKMDNLKIRGKNNDDDVFF